MGDGRPDQPTVDAVFGVPHPGLRVLAVPAGLAPLFARAHHRVHGEPAGAHLGDGRLEVIPGDRDDAGARRLDVDDDTMARLWSASRPVVLAGPGVVHAVPGLHALATSASLGVLNTWGAKGVFDWRSRHHLATAGLQARDFELGGLADADLVIATGLEPSEAPPDHWRLTDVVELAPGALGPTAEAWWRAHQEIAMPPLRTGLARLTRDGWASPSTPLAPSLVTRTYGEEVARLGLVTAEPGLAGYWVARTLPTTRLGSVHVPAEDEPGLAVACAAVGRLRSPNRPVIVAAEGPPPPVVHEVLDAAAGLGAPLAVELWEPDGEVLDAEAHRERLRHLARVDRPTIATLATDARWLAPMLDVAGPVIAWPGRRIGTTW